VMKKLNDYEHEMKAMLQDLKGECKV